MTAYMDKIKNLSAEFDIDLLQNAIGFIRKADNGSSVSYRQMVNKPYRTELQITVYMMNDTWGFDVEKPPFNRAFPEMREALIILTDEILR